MGGCYRASPGLPAARVGGRAPGSLAQQTAPSALSRQEWKPSSVEPRDEERTRLVGSGLPRAPPAQGHEGPALLGTKQK